MNRNNSKYININIDNLDITKLKITRDRDNNGISLNTYSITYEGNEFYIFPNKSFDTYGIKFDNKDNLNGSSIDSNSDYTDIESNNNFKKISIIFDDNNRYHVIYKKVIIDIYKQLSNNLKNVKIHNPINNYNAMNLEINDKTLIYEYNRLDQKIDKLVIQDVIKYRNFPCKIAPIIYFKKFNRKNDILYFNLCIKSVIIEYIRFPMDFDQIVTMFDYTDIKRDNNIIEQSDNNDDDSDEINFI